MLRKAVINHLIANATGLGGRVYQAFLAPSGVVKPYATVKLATSRGSPGISYAGDQPVEVRIYDDQASFVPMDELEIEVIKALNGIDIVDPDGGERYCLQWDPNGGTDFVDEEKKLIGRLITFEGALLFEPGGGSS